MQSDKFKSTLFTYHHWSAAYSPFSFIIIGNKVFQQSNGFAAPQVIHRVKCILLVLVNPFRESNNFKRLHAIKPVPFQRQNLLIFDYLILLQLQVGVVISSTIYKAKIFVLIWKMPFFYLDLLQAVFCLDEHMALSDLKIPFFIINQMSYSQYRIFANKSSRSMT